VAGLWAAVEAAAAAAANDTASPFSRIAGFVFTLVPTWGEHRNAVYDELAVVADRVYGGFQGAMDKNKRDCSPGFGCISFAKHIAAKRSNCPSVQMIRDLKVGGVLRSFTPCSHSTG
jgi:hypothetical protein